MPTWGDILVELNQNAAQRNGPPDFDLFRRRYLSHLAQLTGRDTIIYYSDWLAGGSPSTAITLEDMQGMMEVCKGLKSKKLDLLLHSPGGSAEATDSLVRYLRTRFEHIRVIVPLAAMSAGTMMALSGDEIVMGTHSQLGPIDPQILTSAGGLFTPARAIVEQFDRAKTELAKDLSLLPAWAPILQQYGPGLLALCDDAEKLAKRLVREWLEAYMFAGLAEDERHKQAEKVTDYFADYPAWRSHSLAIRREQAIEAGLPVTELEDNPEFQDAVLSVHHSTMHTFQGPAVKIIENHLGRAFVKMEQRLAFPMQMPQAAPPTSPTPVPPPQPAQKPPPSRPKPARRQPKRRGH